MPDATLEERCLEAMVWPARIRMSAWAAALNAHRGHRTFHVQQWPHSLEWGFTCECSGTEREWRIRISEMKRMLPETLEAVRRLYRHPPGSGISKRARHRATIKARALLHRHLTKPQRWELRATKAFTVTGQDGRTYLVTEGTANNVRLLVDDKPRYSLCVVFHNHAPLPIYDLMLAQKVLLENDIQLFLRTARCQHLETHAIFPNGAFLLGEEAEEEPPPQPGRFEILPIERADIENPQAWVAARLQEAQGNQGEAHGDPDPNRDPHPAAAE